jgi:hypothetical protein
MLDEHRTELNLSMNNWRIVVFFTALFIFSVNLIPEFTIHIWTIEFKLPVLSIPKTIALNSISVFVLFFWTIQYWAAKRQYEEYSFKYISAFWLPAYLEIINEKDENKALLFLERTITEIYKKPREIEKNSIIDYLLEFFKSTKFNLNDLFKDFSEQKIDEVADYLKTNIKR